MLFDHGGGCAGLHRPRHSEQHARRPLGTLDLAQFANASSPRRATAVHCAAAAPQPGRAKRKSEKKKSDKERAAERSVRIAKQTSWEVCANDLHAQCGCDPTADDEPGPCFQRFRKFMKWMYEDEGEREAEKAAWKAVQRLRSMRYCHRPGEEGDWLWEEMLGFRVANCGGNCAADKSKFRLEYKLEGVPMCKEAWHHLAGWNNMAGKVRKQIPRRALQFEARIRSGKEARVATKGEDKKPSSAAGNNTDLCRRWCHDYLNQVSCTVPAVEGGTRSGTMYYSKMGAGFEYFQYVDDYPEERRLHRSGFNRVWRWYLDNGWTCESTNAHYDLEVRTIRARGFKKCGPCEDMEEELRVATRERKPKAVRNQIRARKREHLKETRGCRQKYGDHIHESLTIEGTGSAAMDGAAQKLHRLPITASDHARVQSMEKLQLKITGVLMHGGHSKGYYAIVTPPWVKTGANLTCTIVMLLVVWGALRNMKKWYLQVDGASDNIAYTVLYFMTWLLLMAQAGVYGDSLVLESVVLSRLPVGHTHIDIDQVFSILARYLWGSKSDIRRAHDIHTLEAFLDAIGKAHAKSIKKTFLLGSSFDFDAFLSDVKHNLTDRGIQMWHVFELYTDPERRGKVFLRTKLEMTSEEWVPWRSDHTEAGQFWPNGSGSDMPGPQRPAAAGMKTWDKKADVVAALRWFIDTQAHVAVTEDTKAKLTALIDSIPTAASVPAPLPWPEIAAPVVEPPPVAPAARAGPAGGAAAAAGENRPPPAFILNAREDQDVICKGDLLVLVHGGQLKLARAAADARLGTGGQIALVFYVQADNVPHFNGRFKPPGPRTRAQKYRVADVSVFWVGQKSALLSNATKPKIKKDKKRRLSGLAAFPLGFDEGAASSSWVARPGGWAPIPAPVPLHPALPAPVPASFGLSAAEEREAAKVRKANADFAALRRLRKNDIAVVFHDGALDLVKIASAINLDEAESMKVDYYINKPPSTVKTAAQTREWAANPTQWDLAFYKPKKWLDTLKTAEATVYWAGTKCALLNDQGFVKVEMRKTLARIDSFPSDIWEPRR